MEYDRCQRLAEKHTERGSTCIVERLRFRDCSVALPRRCAICFSCDRCDAFPDHDNRPDFIAYYDDRGQVADVWLVVEIKGRTDSITEIVAQLKAGATTIQNHELYRLNSPRTRRLVAVVLFHGKNRAADYDVLRKQKINFSGKNYPIRAMRCRPGITLQSLL